MISVFIDTNILHCSDANLKEVRFANKLQSIISEIEINDIYTEVKLIIPMVVICELYEQQIEAYEEWIDKLRNVALPNMELDKEFNYEEYLRKLFDEEIRRLGEQLVQIELADFPKNECLENIIYRSIKKEPPFEGKKQKSDKGFKDVIIWETLKEYKNRHINETIVLYCNDNLLSDSSLQLEYNKEFRDNIQVVKKGELIECLTKQLNTKMEKTFAEQLEQRLVHILNESNNIFYDMLMEQNEWPDGDRIVDFRVEDVAVLKCDDEKIDNKIFYDIELCMSLKYSDDMERETYKRKKTRNAIVCYDFDKDDFGIKEFDNLVLGRCILNEVYSLTGEVSEKL